MRYLFGFLCVCALGVVPLVGCDVGVGGLCLFEPCPDECEGVVCPDDGNECTEEGCDGGSCDRSPAPDGWNCDFGGDVGVCISGVCEKDLWCGGVACKKECIKGHCDLVAGTCEYYIAVEDGTTCSGGICLERVCVTLTDQCTADDLAAIDAGEEPGSDCTEGVEWTFECFTVVGGCLQELSGTSLSSPCLRCYALGACCMLRECDSACDAPPLPGDDCDMCIQEMCQPQVDVCVGGQ